MQGGWREKLSISALIKKYYVYLIQNWKWSLYMKSVNYFQWDTCCLHPKETFYRGPIELHHMAQWQSPACAELQCLKNKTMLLQKSYKFPNVVASQTSPTRQHRRSGQSPKFQEGHARSAPPTLKPSWLNVRYGHSLLFCSWVMLLNNGH